MSVICSLMSSNIKSSTGRRLEPILSTWMTMDKFNTRNNYRLRVMSFDKSSGNARQHHLESPEQRSSTEDENSCSETESVEKRLTSNRPELSIPITTTQTSSSTISHQLPRIQTVRRRLFSDSSTNPETERVERQRYLDEQLDRISREKCEKYNFDFVAGTPLNRPGATYEWQRITTSSTVQQCSTSSSSSMTKVATCTCITTSTTRQTSLISMLPVRCKSRTSTTTSVSTVCRGIKRPLSCTSTSTEKLSSEEGPDSKRSKMMVSSSKIGSSKFVEHTASSSPSTSTLRTQSPTSSTTSTSSSDTVIVDYNSDEAAQY